MAQHDRKVDVKIYLSDRFYTGSSLALELHFDRIIHKHYGFYGFPPPPPPTSSAQTKISPASGRRARLNVEPCSSLRKVDMIKNILRHTRHIKIHSFKKEILTVSFTMLSWRIGREGGGGGGRDATNLRMSHPHIEAR